MGEVTIELALRGVNIDRQLPQLFARAGWKIDALHRLLQTCKRLRWPSAFHTTNITYGL